MDPSYIIAKHRISKAEDKRESMVDNYNNHRYNNATNDAYHSIFQLIMGVLSFDEINEEFDEFKILDRFVRDCIELDTFRDEIFDCVCCLFGLEQELVFGVRNITKEEFQEVFAIHDYVYFELKNYIINNINSNRIL